MQITERQRQIYDFILRYRREHGCSPSIPEMQRHFRMASPNGVAGHLHALQAKGLIRRAERGSRQIDVVGPGGSERGALFDLPLLGAIPAGAPEAIHDVRADACVTVDESTLGFKPQEGCFVLRVRGESMRDAGILNGDLVIVQPTPSPRAGQIVAALIDGESTLKRLVRTRTGWYLKAENPAFPELIPRADLVIHGVVRTVIRRFE